MQKYLDDFFDGHKDDYKTKELSGLIVYRITSYLSTVSMTEKLRPESKLIEFVVSNLESHVARDFVRVIYINATKGDRDEWWACASLNRRKLADWFASEVFDRKMYL